MSPAVHHGDDPTATPAVGGRRPRRSPAWLMALALLTAACSSGTDTGGRSSGPTTTTPIDSSTAGDVPDSTNPLSIEGGAEPDYDKIATDVLAMSNGEQTQYLTELAASIDQRLALDSGLEAVLGGPDATSTALHDAWAPLFDQVRTALRQPIQLGFRSAPQDAPNIGESLFGMLMTIGLGSEAVVSVSNDLPVGKVEKAEIAPGMNVEASTTNAVLDVKVSNTTKDGVTTKLTVHLEVAPCPGPDGRFTAKASAEMSATAGSVGGTGSLEVSLDGQLDDDAKLASTNIDFRMQMADFAGGKGKYSDVSGGYTGDTFNGLTFNRTGGDADEKYLTQVGISGIMYALMVSHFLTDAARKGWESGRCVRIDASASPGPKGLEPGSSSTVSAAPRSKIDGAPTGGTVTATLSAGGANVEPSSTPLPADAEFTYLAPDERNKSGTVSLEARSRRGVGSAAVDLDTSQTSYTATYNGGGIGITGTIDDLSQPFTTIGKFAGGSATFDHIPADDRSGTIDVGGGGSGAVLSGSGTYTIVENGDGTLTMNESISSCVAPNGSCRETAHAVLLTPI